MKLEAALNNYCKKSGRGEPRIWLVGDLVNRGFESLAVLRWCFQNRHRIRVVLGNHDLHLLAIVAGIRQVRSGDTLNDILCAPDREALINWLRHQPLAYCERGWLMVHAGVLPQWSTEHVLELSREVSAQLRGPYWQQFLTTMYGNQPNHWSPDLRGADRYRVIINALTRLRFCNEKGAMEFDSKESVEKAPAGFQAWFTHNHNRATQNQPMVFGHWSTLGLINSEKLLAIDTGFVWGRQLTAIELTANPAKRKLIQVSAV